MDTNELEEVNRRLNAKYEMMKHEEQRFEEYCVDDAEYVYQLILYGEE